MSAVTVTLGGNNYSCPLFVEGQLFGFAGLKRIKGKINKVESTDDSHTLTCTKGYYPSPKSRLRKENKSPFSKIHHRILK